MLVAAQKQSVAQGPVVVLLGAPGGANDAETGCEVAGVVGGAVVVVVA